MAIQFFNQGVEGEDAWKKTLVKHLNLLARNVATLETHFPEPSAPASLSGTATDIDVTNQKARLIFLSVVAMQTNGTSDILLRLGTGGVITASGYAGGAIKASGASAVVAEIPLSTGFRISGDNNASTRIYHGTIELKKHGNTNTWACSSRLGMSETGRMVICAGSIALSGVLDILRFTTSGGANTFSGGAVGMMVI